MNYQKTAFNLIETSFISIHIMSLSRACVLLPAAAGAAKGTKRSLIWDDSKASVTGHPLLILMWYDLFWTIKQTKKKPQKKLNLNCLENKGIYAISISADSVGGSICWFAIVQPKIT